MSTVTQVLIYGSLAGLTIPLGALLSQHATIRSRWVASEVQHGILAIGAGALLAAVALVLIPEGMEALSLPSLTIAFFAGGAVFAWVDWVVARHGSPVSQVVAMLTDFLPECLALGALFVVDNSAAILLAILIAVQNLPESFSAYREVMEGSGATPVKALVAFALLAPLGPLAAYTGLSYLHDKQIVVSLIMTFAAGGVLYLMFQDIAPKVALKKAWLPPMGALVGFFIGVLGSVLLT